MTVANLLLVIDVQERTMQFITKKNILLEKINRVITKFEQNHDPIIYIKQQIRGELFPQIKVDGSAPIFTKNQPSAFTQEKFAQKVHNLDPQNIVVVGLLSNACIRATVKSALTEGYSVTLISDGHDSIIEFLRNYYNHVLTK